MTKAERLHVGQALRVARIRKGLTQHELARHPRVRIAVGTLQAIETGTRETRESKLEKLAKFFGTTIPQLRQAEQVAPTDVLFQGLRSEHLRIAHAYKNAETDERACVRAVLEHSQGQAGLLQRVLAAGPDLWAQVESHLQQLDTPAVGTTAASPPMKAPAK